MEKTRFNNLKYEHFNIRFKGLDFEIKLIDNNAFMPNYEKDKPTEQFKIIVKNGDKEIYFYFYNSQMEKAISDYLGELKHLAYNNKTFKSFVSIRFSCGGYDSVKSLRDLINKRIEHLFYSIVCDMGFNLTNETESFNFFCDNFGYDKDSIKALKIYESVKEYKEKIESLDLTEQQRTYLINQAQQETKKFSSDIETAIKTATEFNF